VRDAEEARRFAGCEGPIVRAAFCAEGLDGALSRSPGPRGEEAHRASDRRSREGATAGLAEVLASPRPGFAFLAGSLACLHEAAVFGAEESVAGDRDWRCPEEVSASALAQDASPRRARLFVKRRNVLL
jgi:hypothetical protein